MSKSIGLPRAHGNKSRHIGASINLPDGTKLDTAAVGRLGRSHNFNRLALLQFLRERNVDARLLFIYFTSDRADLGAPGRDGPRDEDEWRPALNIQKHHVGLSESAPALTFVSELFLPAYRVSILTDRVGINQNRR
jgi:hypothetical protein